jgi:FtsZ-interacting cell division protein ZipA
MNLRQVPYPSEAFELMINVAEQLAEDLDGELRAGKSLPWSKDLFQQYQEKVFLYEK